MFTGIHHLAYRVHDRDGAPWIHYLRVSDSTFLELFPGGVPPVDADEHSIGPMHPCLHSEDLHATFQELTARGLSIEDAPRAGPLGNRKFWLEDPDGNSIEIVQQLPGNLIEQSLARR